MAIHPSPATALAGDTDIAGLLTRYGSAAEAGAAYWVYRTAAGPATRTPHGGVVAAHCDDFAAAARTERDAWEVWEDAVAAATPACEGGVLPQDVHAAAPAAVVSLVALDGAGYDTRQGVADAVIAAARAKARNLAAYRAARAAAATDNAG